MQHCQKLSTGALRISLILIAASIFCVADCSAANDPATASPRETTVAGLSWQTDYPSAFRLARSKKQLLLINFVDDPDSTVQQELEQTISSDSGLQEKLRGMVLLRVSQDAEILTEGKPEQLLGLAAFQEMHGHAGIAMIDLAHADEPYFGRVVSAYPFTSGKYYRWQSQLLATILDLPPGTITQRSMVWAIRVHSHNPASTQGTASPVLMTAAASHSVYQARTGNMGHHNSHSRFSQIRASIPGSRVSEVAAQSWRNQTMLDSCLDCVRSWRHSSGHWSSIRRHHRLYGYDICQGRSGLWYGTGIFAD